MRDWCALCQAMRFRSECNHPPVTTSAASSEGQDCRETLVGVSLTPCRHGYTWQCPTAAMARKTRPAPEKGIRC